MKSHLDKMRLVWTFSPQTYRESRILSKQSFSFVSVELFAHSDLRGVSDKAVKGNVPSSNFDGFSTIAKADFRWFMTRYTVNFT